MNPKQFLLIGGVILVLLGILGYVGILGPTAEQSIFGTAWWFDNYENIAHFVLGIIALLAVYVIPESAQKPLVIMVGVVAVLFGLYSLFVDTNFYGVNLENPADTLLHLVVGAWALWAGMKKDETAPVTM